MFRYFRSYCGPVKGVVFDWAGTLVDYGCFAPTVVFIEIFKRFGVEISVAEARAPMGGHKRDHIREILMSDNVSARWATKHGKMPNEDDVEAMFKEFVPAQIEAVKQHSDIIPGSLETVAWLREEGIHIGSSTGYSREIMVPVIELAEAGGLSVDYLVCADEVPSGRPAPWMCFDNARHFNSYPMEAWVKIGDTVPDILEGLNAGTWTVGVTVTGNEMGLTFEEVSGLTPQEVRARREVAAARLLQAGAHYVVNGIEEVPDIIEEIRERLDAGDRP